MILSIKTRANKVSFRTKVFFCRFLVHRTTLIELRFDSLLALDDRSTSKIFFLRSSRWPFARVVQFFPDILFQKSINNEVYSRIQQNKKPRGLDQGFRYITQMKSSTHCTTHRGDPTKYKKGYDSTEHFDCRGTFAPST